MPIPIIIGAAIAGAAAVSYLAPLIIACVVGATTTIISFFIAKKVYEKKEAAELAELRKQRMDLERQTRAGAEKLAQHTGDHVEMILNTAQKQQQHLGTSIHHLNKSVEETSQATENLERVAVSMQHAAHATTITIEAMSADLERLKSELISVNLTLKTTQDALATKERELKNTIDKLAAIEVQMATNARESAAHMAEFTKGLSAAQTILHPDREATRTDVEMTSLRSKTTRMTLAIQTLEATVEQLSSKLTHSTAANHAQFSEIRALLDENKRLTGFIDDLSKALEEQDVSSAAPRSSIVHQIRMFKHK